MATTVSADVRATLAADATLIATVTGVILDAMAEGSGWINWKDQPTAYGADATSGVKILLPSMAVSYSTEGAAGSRRKGRQGVLRIGFYDDEGYANIETAMLRTKVLLDETNQGWHTLTDGSNYHLTFMDGRNNLEDDTVQTGKGKRPAAHGFQRYQYDLGW